MSKVADFKEKIAFKIRKSSHLGQYITLSAFIVLREFIITSI